MAPTRAVILEGADGGYAAARALRRRGVPVTMISRGWVTRARGIDGRRATTRDEWLAELARRRLAGPGRADSRLRSGGRVRLAGSRSHPVRPALLRGTDSAHFKLMDKGSLYSLAAQAGVRAPVVKLLSSRDEIDAVAASAVISVTAEADALAPLPRAVRAPPQHPGPRPR